MTPEWLRLQGDHLQLQDRTLQLQNDPLRLQESVYYCEVKDYWIEDFWTKIFFNYRTLGISIVGPTNEENFQTID
jgi:hypothetical protein